MQTTPHKLDPVTRSTFLEDSAAREPVTPRNPGRRRTASTGRASRSTRVPGEHAVIIDQGTCDKVHAILAENAVIRANGTRAQTPALLRGLIFAPGGHAMTPLALAQEWPPVSVLCQHRRHPTGLLGMPGAQRAGGRGRGGGRCRRCGTCWKRRRSSPRIWAAAKHRGQSVCQSVRSSSTHHRLRAALGRAFPGRAGAHRPPAGRARSTWLRTHHRLVRGLQRAERAADAGRAAPHNGCEGARGMRAKSQIGEARLAVRRPRRSPSASPMAFVPPRRPQGDRRPRRRRRLGAGEAAARTRR